MEAKVTCAVLANDALAVDNLNDDTGSGHDHGEFHADMFTAWALQNIKKDKGRLDIISLKWAKSKIYYYVYENELTNDTISIKLLEENKQQLSDDYGILKMRA